MGWMTLLVLVIVFNVCLGSHTNKFPGYYPYPVFHKRVDSCVGQFFCKYTPSSSGISWEKSNGQAECLNKMKICDGMMDCSNGADENHCPPQCAKMGMMNCQDRKHCGRLCDGSPDCGGMDDEKHCPAGCFCPENHYLCKDSKTCVSKKQLCDGNNDCPACDDEEDCPAECKCGEREYLCMGKAECINIKQICDGDEDCPMDEDEDCRDGCRCKQGEYLCDGGDKCVPREQLCNGGVNSRRRRGGGIQPLDCPNGDHEFCGPTPARK